MALGKDGISLNDFYASYASSEGSNLDGGTKSSGKIVEPTDEPKVTTAPPVTTAKATTTAAVTTAAVTTTVFTPSSGNEDLGDANVDGKVDLNDAVAILQYVALPAKYKLSDEGVDNADIIDRGTSGVNGKDALAVQMVDSKLIGLDKLPLTSAQMESYLK